MGLTENATIKELQEIPNISSENRVRSIRTFPNEKNNIFVNFHIISAYNSEISSELSEYSEKNSELSEYSEKNSELSEYSELTSEKNSELSEYTSEKNSELS